MNVIWTEDALDRLADAYVALALDEQRDLERAVGEINGRLASEAPALGESRGTARRRVWFARPLVVQFDFRSAPAEVVVFHVNLLRNTSAGDAE